jgi:hypothetical protein
MNATTGSYAIAFGLPLNEAVRQLEASALTLRNASDKVAASSKDSFGQRLRSAVQARLRPRVVAANTPQAEEESFGEKLRRAVKQKSPRKQHEQQAARDSKRYPKPRQRTLSE